MKKQLVYAIMLLMAACIAEAKGLYLKGGLQIITKLNLHETISGTDFFTDDDIRIYPTPGFHLELEYTRPVRKSVELGLGICYESEPREQHDWETFGFNMTPMYGILKFDVLQRETLDLFISGRLGYGAVHITNENIADSDDHDGHVYYGIGVTLEEKEKSSVIWALYYSTSKAGFEVTSMGKSITHEYTYSALSVTIGKRFDL